MEYKDGLEHPVALKVMRLTKPSLAGPQIVTCDAKDLPGNLLNGYLKDDVAAVGGAETLAAGQFLLVPQSFGNIYLGETFSCYLCVHNETRRPVDDVSVKADLQTNSQHIPLSTGGRRRSRLGPDDALDDVIHHEVKDVGTHILVCEVGYSSPTLDTPASFRKFFKFQVTKPLDVKTKFYNASDDSVYYEAQIQNITAGPIWLERVSLENSSAFRVESLNDDDGGDADLLRPQASCQRLYRLTPVEPAPLAVEDAAKGAPSTDVGKLDIVWRSSAGERGRLQTSRLQRKPPERGEARLTFERLPGRAALERPFEFRCKVVNASDRRMDLVLKLRSDEAAAGLVWSGASDRRIGALEPGAATAVELCAVPIQAGLQAVSGITLVDTCLKRAYDFDDLASVFVT